ncbi:hypothetical protein CKO51_30935 [Rhodopirellula sp. SM50]|nr:hypothetical protein CKO51_30935 [Rhodopirellula sp. SM50]
MQRDEQARLEAAEERGEARGEAIGRVRVLQSLAGVAESTIEDLRMRSSEELAAMEVALKRQLRERN